MMRKLEYYFRETASGLRRNGVVAFAAMSTAFIALFLFGLALLISKEFDLVIQAWTGNLQVAVYLDDPVAGDTVARVQQKLDDLPVVTEIEYWDKTITCEQYNNLFANQPVFLEGVDCRATIPTSLRANLNDAAQFDQITAALACEDQIDDDGSARQVCAEPGVLRVSDFSALLDRLVVITRVLSFGVLAIAALMLGSAIALVANTLRMGMFARRKEIGIMRLVGATNWRIRVPFLIEGLVEAMLGAVAAIAGLFLVKVFVVDNLRGTAPWLPLIKNSDVVVVMPWILAAAALVAIVAGTIGMRRFLDV
jgi:cell division transport system permease protein